jgi:hypothetical protein
MRVRDRRRPPDIRAGTRTQAPARTAWVVDAAGAALLSMLIGVLLAQSRGDRSTPLKLLLVCAAAFVAARLLGGVRWPVVPAAVLVGGIVASALDRPVGAFGDFALGALLAQAAIAAVMVARDYPRRWSTSAGISVALACSLVAVVTYRAAVASIAPLLLTLPAVLRARWARVTVALLCVAFLVVLAATVVVAAREPDDRATAAAASVRPGRAALWHAAWLITLEPGAAGPGRFDNVPPRFLPEGDVRWAYHDFLEQAAELGWEGLVLTSGLFVWGFIRLLVVRRADAITALGAASLAALGIQACFDPVMHVAAVPILATMLVGWAVGRSRPLDPD